MDACVCGDGLTGTHEYRWVWTMRHGAWGTGGCGDFHTMGGRAWPGWGRTSASLDDAARRCDGLVVLYGGVGAD
ncbi:hypothetical protein JB92DRAFT_2930443 [Gautieria morchelliformis]|nr:hypothetical protein JB92DRAFT_3033677 [Gautieria morchelliformis]KAF8512134.1 hypothetical protein JB92DRAFT_2930443 [Gautieria morchelliformis]